MDIQPENPCTDCPGMPIGCRYDEKNRVCRPIPLNDGQRIKQLLKRATGLSAPAAFNILRHFSGDREVIWPLKGTPKGLKTEILLKTFVGSDDANWCMAETVHFKFWGGPPNKLGYYNGSLETMLHDRILDFVNLYGVNEAEKAFRGEVVKVRNPCGV